VGLSNDVFEGDTHEIKIMNDRNERNVLVFKDGVCGLKYYDWKDFGFFTE
jgi:hypothetical protein